jgi:small-conductance mechanosensitive channel
MHTLFDFISSVNALQYGLALFFVFGFILFNEILKPRPFDGLLKSFVEDVRFIRSQDRLTSLQLGRKIVVALFYILAYLAALPFLFIQGMAVLSFRGMASVTSAGWSPVRAYFAGRKKIKRNRGKSSGQRTPD